MTTGPRRDAGGSGGTLTPKQARFVAEYLIDLNATQAAIRAGYSARTAEQQGPRLLGNVGVAAAIQAGKAAQLEALEFDARRVLQELGRLAFTDLRAFFDAAGNLKAVAELTADQGAALASFEVLKKNAVAGDGHIDTIHKFKVWDKTKALETLARHFGLLNDKLQITGDDANIARLLAGRKRAADGRTGPA